MKKSIILTFAFLLSIIVDNSFGQVTKLMELWSFGNDRIDLFISFENKNYYLNAMILMDEGYYVDKGEEFKLITINNDTLKLIGKNEGQFIKYTGTPHQRLGLVLYTFTNSYLLSEDQIKVLRSTKITKATMGSEIHKRKMEIDPFNEDHVIKLFEKIDKQLN